MARTMAHVVPLYPEKYPDWQKETDSNGTYTMNALMNLCYQAHESSCSSVIMAHAKERKIGNVAWWRTTISVSI